MTMSLSSPAFADGESIPARYTSDGEDVSPPLRWSGIPPEAKSLVLIVDDPDAPDPRAPKTRFTHWVLYNLPAATEGLPEDVTAFGLPAGASEGKNDWDRDGYGGPKPPVGRHRYVHRLFALDTRLPEGTGLGSAEVAAAMEGHVIARAQMVGTYEAERGRRRRAS